MTGFGNSYLMDNIKRKYNYSKQLWLISVIRSSITTCDHKSRRGDVCMGQPLLIVSIIAQESLSPVLVDVNCARGSMTRQNCYRGDCMKIVMSKSSLKGDGLSGGMGVMIERLSV